MQDPFSDIITYLEARLQTLNYLLTTSNPADAEHRRLQQRIDMLSQMLNRYRTEQEDANVDAHRAAPKP